MALKCIYNSPGLALIYDPYVDILFFLFFLAIVFCQGRDFFMTVLSKAELFVATRQPAIFLFASTFEESDGIFVLGLFFSGENFQISGPLSPNYYTI